MQREELKSILTFPSAKRRPQTTSNPNLPKWMFWDLRYEELDWKESYLYVIQRVLERGNDDEYAEMIRFYGLDRIVLALSSEISYLPQYVIPRVCAYFGLPQENLLCFRRPAWRTARQN